MSPIHSYIIHTFLLYIYIDWYCNLCILRFFLNICYTAYNNSIFFAVHHTSCVIRYTYFILLYMLLRHHLYCISNMYVYTHTRYICLSHIESLPRADLVNICACCMLRLYKSEINSGVVKGAYGFWTNWIQLNWWVLDESWWIRCPVWAWHSVFSPNIFHFLSFVSTCADGGILRTQRVVDRAMQLHGGLGGQSEQSSRMFLCMTVLPRFAYLRRRIFGSEVKADVQAANH